MSTERRRLERIADPVPVDALRAIAATDLARGKEEGRYRNRALLALLDRLEAAEAKVARVEALADLPADSDDWASIYNAHEADDWYGTFVPALAASLRKALS